MIVKANHLWRIGLRPFRKDGLRGPLSLESTIFVFLQVSFAIWTFYLWRHLPGPGWAVAILAGVAAVVSVHTNMWKWQKAVWMIIIGCLLRIELRAISVDRTTASQAALKDRREQEGQFKQARDLQEKEFQATVGELNAAISGITQTLDATKSTLLQTRPIAIIRLISVQPSEITPVGVGTKWGFNYHFVNGGTAAADDLKILVEIYTGLADDRQTQVDLAHKFEKSWIEANPGSTKVFFPETPSFRTTFYTFDGRDLLTLKSNGTIYYLARFEWNDLTGHWRTDACGSYQYLPKFGINYEIGHPCAVFERQRYRIR